MEGQETNNMNNKKHQKNKFKLISKRQFLFFFFYISNKDSLISKERDIQVHRKYTGVNKSKRILQKSSISKIVEKGWFLHTKNQSSKVRRKRSLRSSMERSMSLKHLLFLSFQIHHIKQRGTTFQISPLRWQPKRPCQQAKSPTTDIGMTQLTPNKPKTISHSSEATGQWRKSWSTLSLLHLHI